MMQGVAIPCLKHFQNNLFGTVLLSLGLLWSAGDYLSNLDCFALRAMTSTKRDSTVMLFVVFPNFYCFVAQSMISIIVFILSLSLTLKTLTGWQSFQVIGFQQLCVLPVFTRF
jgi:hypothetical protein